jgi:hypothetical protein
VNKSHSIVSKIRIDAIATIVFFVEHFDDFMLKHLCESLQFIQKKRSFFSFLAHAPCDHQPKQVFIYFCDRCVVAGLRFLDAFEQSASPACPKYQDVSLATSVRACVKQSHVA